MRMKYRELLNEKDYMCNLSAQFITRIGDGIDTIALSWLTYEITGSASLVAIVYTVNMLPNLLFGIIGGGLSSYISEKNIMWICDIGRGTTTLVIALLFWFNYLTIPLLFVLTFINSTFESLRTPAQMSIFQIIISQEKREKALALQESTNNMASLLGLGAGPLCIGLFGISGAIIIDATSFFICAILVMMISNHKRGIEEKFVSMKTYAKEILEGMKYLGKSKLLVILCFFACFMNALFVPINAFEVVYIKDYLLLGMIGMSVSGVASVLGMIISPLFLPKLIEKISNRIIILSGGILLSLCYLSYALLPYSLMVLRYALLAFIMFMLGVALSMVNYPANLFFYNKIEEKYFARVSSFIRCMAMAMQPLASVIFGFLSDFFPLTIIFYGCAIILFFIFASQFFNKIFYELNG